MKKPHTLILLLILVSLKTAFGILPTPLLTSPADGSQNNPAATKINWYNVTGATEYEFKIDTSASLLSAPVQTSTSSEFTNAQLFYGTTYYWQVRALKTTGIPDSSAWTAVFSFTTQYALNISSPANGASGQFPRSFLNWSNSDGCTNFQVQLDELVTFNSPAFLETTQPDSLSYFYTAQLKFGTTYYWRVRAMHALDTTDWTPIYSFTTLDSVTLTAPTDGASFISPSVELNWDYISGIAKYEVQLDKAIGFNSLDLRTAVLADSISNWAPLNLEFGESYYWRVRAWHAGDTTQWSQTWNFTTLSTLTLTSPGNNTTNQFPNALLNWNYVTDPISYDVEYDTSVSFSSPNYVYASNDSISEHKTADLLFGETYYWHARVHNLADTSQWSSIWSFTVIDNVIQTAPSNGAMSVPSRVTLNWNAVEGTTGYEVLIDTSSSFTSPLNAIYQTSTSDQQVLNLYFGTRYYWKVRAFHSLDTSSWTSAWSFTTADTVVLTAPSNHASQVTPRVNLNWSNLSGSSAYIVAYDTSASFSSAVAKVMTTSSSNYFATNLFFNQRYFWKIKAINLVDTTAWSETWDFITLNELVHTSPLEGDTGQALTTEINWAGVSGAVGYIYRFDTSPLFNVLPQTGNSIGTNSRADISLSQYGQTYYWQVAVFDSVDTSGWSAPWSFTTLYQLTQAPNLLAPADLSTGLSIASVPLSWNSLVGAVSYEYSYATSSTFNGASTFSTTDTTGVINGLNSETVYYWRVRAANAFGYTPWSSVFSFTTLNPFTGVPILFAPEDEATDVPQPVTFTWYPLAFASSYECEYSTDSLFTNSITVMSFDTSASSGLIDPLTTYYWHVRGVDDNAYSAWSSTWKFTTENPLTFATTQIAPADGSTGLSSPISFTWNSLALASSYECEYDVDSLFSSATTLLANDTTVISLPLTPLTKYFWRVRGILGNVSSPWSTVWSFNTENPLILAPVQYDPADLSTGVSSPANFSWFSVAAASSYECEYASDTLFSSAITLLANDTSAVSLSLQSLSTYYWRVRAVLGAATSPWSQIWKFETADGTIPLQVLPLNNDTGLLSPVSFKWTLVGGASSYECQYATDSIFTNPVVLNSSSDTAQSQNLNLLTTYYWRVRASDGTQNYPWSEVWKFTTSFMVNDYAVHSENLGIVIFPNPATNQLFIKNTATQNEQMQVSILSIDGRIVWQNNLSSNSAISINIENLALGCYTVNAISKHQIIRQKLIVK